MSHPSSFDYMVVGKEITDDNIIYIKSDFLSIYKLIGLILKLYVIYFSGARISLYFRLRILIYYIQ